MCLGAWVRGRVRSVCVGEQAVRRGAGRGADQVCTQQAVRHNQLCVCVGCVCGEELCKQAYKGCCAGSGAGRVRMCNCSNCSHTAEKLLKRVIHGDRCMRWHTFVHAPREPRAPCRTGQHRPHITKQALMLLSFFADFDVMVVQYGQGPHLQRTPHVPPQERGHDLALWLFRQRAARLRVFTQGQGQRAPHPRLEHDGAPAALPAVVLAQPRCLGCANDPRAAAPA